MRRLFANRRFGTGFLALSGAAGEVVAPMQGLLSSGAVLSSTGDYLASGAFVNSLLTSSDLLSSTGEYLSSGARA